MVETPVGAKRRRSPSFDGEGTLKRPRRIDEGTQLPSFIQRLTMQVFSMFRRPSSGGVSWDRTDHTDRTRRVGHHKRRPQTGPVINLADSDSDNDADNTESRRRQVDRQKDALQHLNDHLAHIGVGATSAEVAIHPHLQRPLFPSSFDSLGERPASVVQAAAARPNVSARPPTRTYSWAAPEISSPSFTGSQGHRKVKPQSSNRSLRRLDKATQNAMLEQLRGRLEANGEIDVALALQRLESESQVTSARKAKKGRSGNRVHRGPAVLDSFGPDMRVSLDEAVAGSPANVSPLVAPVHPRKSWKPLEPPLHDRQRIQRIIEEEDIKKRLKSTPSIPPDLTAEQKTIITAALGDNAFEARVGNAQINATSIRRLKPGVWLNDEVVNIYAELITQRAQAGKQKVFCWNSYLYEKLATQGYAAANLKRWSKRRKLDMFELDQMLIPINHGNSHWVCAVVNFRQKRFEYYDSMHDSGRRREVFRLLRDYVQAEHKEKKGSDIELSEWQDAFNPDTPKQDNANDCGVFTCQTLEMVARGCDLVDGPFEFSSQNMPFFRRLMVVEIASGKLASRAWAKL